MTKHYSGTAGRAGPWAVRSLARQGAGEPLKPFLIHRVSLLQVIPPQSALATGDSTFITSAATIPSWVPEGLCSSCQLHRSLALPTHPRQGMAAGRRGKEGCESREGEEARGIYSEKASPGLENHHLVGPACNLEHNQSAPEGPVFHFSSTKLVQGLITDNNQAKIRAKCIQKRWVFSFSSTFYKDIYKLLQD